MSRGVHTVITDLEDARARRDGAFSRKLVADYPTCRW
jgi:hypothetical protein